MHIHCFSHNNYNIKAIPKYDSVNGQHVINNNLSQTVFCEKLLRCYNARVFKTESIRSGTELNPECVNQNQP